MMNDNIENELYELAKNALQRYKSAKASVESEEIFSIQDREQLLQILNKERAAMFEDKLRAEKENSNSNHVLVENVDKALSVLKMIPVNGETLFQILDIIYIEKNNFTNDDDRAYSLGLSRPTFLKRKKTAISALSEIIWKAHDIVSVMEEYSGMQIR